MISKSFLRSSLVFTFGGALPMVAGLILLPFYTNYLTEANYTRLLYYISISLLFQILFSFSTESYFGVQYTHLSGNSNKQKEFIGTVSILMLLIGGGLLLLSALLGVPLFRLVYNDELGVDFWPYGFYSILTAFFNAYFKTATVCLIYLKRPGEFLLVNFINFLITIIISIGGLYLFPGTLVGPIYGRLLSGAAIFVLAQFVFMRNGAFVFQKEFLKELIKFCTPYLVFVLSGWVLGQIDRYFLQTGISKADLNAYDLMLKCFFGIEFLQNSLSAVIYPKLFEIWGKNGAHRTTPESNRYMNVFSAINVMQLIAFCICIPFVYVILISNNTFYASKNYIGVLAAGYALRSIVNFYISTILFSKRIDVLLKIFGFSAVLQIILTKCGVLYLGLNGAIYAGLTTKALQVLLCVYFTRPVFVYEFNYFKILLVPFLYFGLNVVQFFFFPVYNINLYLLQMLLFGVLFGMLFKNEIRRTAKDLLTKQA